MSREVEYWERPSTELEERKTWATLALIYPDGTTETFECMAIKALIVKKNDYTGVYAVGAGVMHPEQEAMMIQSLPKLFPELQIVKGAENGTDTETE